MVNKKKVIITAIVIACLALAVAGIFILSGLKQKPNMSFVGTWQDKSQTDTYWTVSENKLIKETVSPYTNRSVSSDIEINEEEKTFSQLTNGNVTISYSYSIDESGKNVEITEINAAVNHEDNAQKNGKDTVIRLQRTDGVNKSEIPVLSSFTKDNALVGSWVNEELGFTYVFDNNGYVTTKNGTNDNVQFKCAYAYDGTNLIIKNSTDKENKVSIEVGDQVMRLNGTVFNKKGE